MTEQSSDPYNDDYGKQLVVILWWLGQERLGVSGLWLITRLVSGKYGH